MKKKIILMTVVIGVISFMLSRVLWPDHAGTHVPTSAQLPHFIFLSALESLAFGFGSAYLIVGWKRAKEALSRKDNLTFVTFIVIVWSLISWWPHDNLHRIIGENLNNLIAIEYTFHMTLIVSASIIGAYFMREAHRRITS